MKQEDLKHRKIELEQENNELRREIYELDQLMRLAGFTNGLETVKYTAQEIVRLNERNLPEEDTHA